MTKRKEQKMDIRCDAIKVSISKGLRMSIKFQQNEEFQKRVCISYI